MIRAYRTRPMRVRHPPACQAGKPRDKFRITEKSWRLPERTVETYRTQLNIRAVISVSGIFSFLLPEMPRRPFRAAQAAIPDIVRSGKFCSRLRAGRHPAVSATS
ncbi:hypothetical protein AGR1B_Lc10678 [Agrobacterium fabacearum S56]|nr:hypothetical protein AGR1B_Lc10678 [Agrobacterium fabacearum S56]